MTTFTHEPSPNQTRPLGAENPFVEFALLGRQFYYAPSQHSIFRELPQNTPNPAPCDRPRTVPRVNTLWLGLTDACNLACDYCFRPPSRQHPPMMSRETAQRAIIGLAHLCHTSSERATIIFFGGEPLLNRSTLEYSVHFAREWTSVSGVQFDFIVATNGTLLDDDTIDLFSRERFCVQVSIDGSPETHNLHRRLISGKGSHREATAKLNRLIGSGVRVTARATIADNSVPYSTRLASLRALGCQSVFVKFAARNAGHGVGSEPVVMHDPQDYDNAVQELLSAERTGVRIYPHSDHVASLTTKRWRGFVCASGTAALSVSPDGWIFPCHRFHEVPTFRQSHVSEPFRHVLGNVLGNLGTDSIQQCSDCWARRFCWGCCPAESLAFGLTLGTPTPAWCAAKKSEAIISLKLAAAKGVTSSDVNQQPR